MPDYIAILDFLENNHGKEYKNPERCEGEERSRNIALKNAGTKIGEELRKISNNCFKKYHLRNDGSIKWQENNGRRRSNKVKEYLWLQMKYEDAIQYPFGIALFAEMTDNQARFRVGFEIKTKDVKKEDLDRYHLHLNIPKKDDMVYFAGNDEINDLITVNKDVNEIKTDIFDGKYNRVQVSLCINKDGTKTNEQYEQEINDAIAKLLPYYEYVLGKEDEMNNEKKQEIKRHLMSSENIILHGAPGTGKSYLAKQIAADIVSDGRTSIYSELTPDEKKRIEFVQFHPSYDYTDFVEGLRPKLNNDGSMGFELQDGIFMKFVTRARENFEDSQKTEEEIFKEQSAELLLSKFINSIHLGEGGTEFKTITQNRFFITDIDDKHIYILMPDNKTTKELSLDIKEVKKMLESGKDFKQVKDITAFFEKKNATQNFSYDYVIYKEIKKMKVSNTKKANVEALKKFVFIIDEINRGEISKIFGELFYSIDPGYRGKAGEISTQYANLHSDPNEKFYIPDNIYIIGTMNDIDRSVDSFDFAMRRRFRFIELKANEMTEMLDSLDEKKQDALNRMTRLNEAIKKVEGLNENYQIGAAYFLKLKEIDTDQLWSDYLEPLLIDYIQGMPNEEEILTSFKKAYNGEETPNGVNADANSEG